jgi:hypothetical protein
MPRPGATRCCACSSAGPCADEGPIAQEPAAVFRRTARILLSGRRRCAADLIQSFKQVATDQAAEDRRSFDVRD